MRPPHGDTDLPLVDRFPDAQPFFFPGKEAAALLVHGFTSTPAEARPIGEMITKRFGWSVSAILLPGHGTQMSDLGHYKWSDWYHAVERGRSELSSSFPQVHLVGFSMGALLCIEFFRRHPHLVASLALLAPPIRFKIFSQRVKAWLISYFPGFDYLGSIAKQNPPHPDNVAYDRYPIRAARQFELLRRKTCKLARLDAPPTFICYSENDDVVHPASVEFLETRLRNPKNKICRIDEPIHALALGKQKGRVLDELAGFYSTNLE